MQVSRCSQYRRADARGQGSLRCRKNHSWLGNAGDQGRTEEETSGTAGAGEVAGRDEAGGDFIGQEFADDYIPQTPQLTFSRSPQAAALF